ncbi:hypothetical protein PS2_009398 [Malus domestica]
MRLYNRKVGGLKVCQQRGVPLCLSSSSNITRLAMAIGQVEEVEDPSMACGFLRAKVLVDTTMPLITGCWLPSKQKQDTWIEFSYERLQDFCYRCGRIGHMNTDCPFEQHRGGGNGYGDWLKAAPIREIIERPRPAQTNLSGRKTTGMKRLIESGGGGQRVGCRATPSSEANVASTEGPTHIEAARIPSEMQTWRQIGGSNIVDLKKGSCPWALAEHLHVINGQLGRASGLLGPQSSRTLDFHIPLDLSPSVRLVHLDEGPYGVTGRPTAGSSLTEDAEAQDEIHLKSTTGMENPMMHVIQTPLLVSYT